MKLGAQIKKHRKELKLSQDELADKVYVTRQSISNWENDKTYPDINSLLLLSDVFSITLDDLIKGDLEIMESKVNIKEIETFENDSKILTLLFIALVCTPYLVYKYFSPVSLTLYMMLFGFSLYWASRVEKQKKINDIQTYKEIIAFCKGIELDEIEKARESGKRNYQKSLLTVAAGIITLVVFMLLIWLLK